MEYDAVQLPERLLEGCDKGSWIVRNARFRSAVCDYLQLRWLSCISNGNCFFESACVLLHSLSIRPDLTAAQLRADVVQYLRLCPGSTQDLPERICIEMSDELAVPLVCSTRGRLNDTRHVSALCIHYTHSLVCGRVLPLETGHVNNVHNAILGLCVLRTCHVRSHKQLHASTFAGFP